MPKILIENQDNLLINYEDKSDLILNVILKHTDWMHACGGKGKCTTCKMVVLSGNEDLSPITPSEEHFIKLERLALNERLACQVRSAGPLRIRASDMYKLPHIVYSD